MMLLKIRDYLQENDSVPVRDLALKFNISQDKAKSMLDHWVKKGMAQKQPANSLCQSGCRSCDPSTIEIYTWVYQKTKP